MSKLQYAHASEFLKPAYEQMLKPKLGPDLPWWKTLSNYWGGLAPNQITLFCAPTGCGKTAFLSNVAAQLLKARVPTFFAPVETGAVDTVIRIQEALTGRELNSGDEISESVVSEVAGKTASVFESAPLFVAKYEDRVDPDEMISVMDFLYRTEKIQVCLLDNLNFFLKVVSQDKAIEVMDSVIHKLVMFVKTRSLHVVLVLHPKKTENGRVISEFDLKGSSTAVQESHCVLLMNRPTKDDIENKNKHPTDREFVFKKLRRRGKYVNHPVWMAYKHNAFQELR